MARTDFSRRALFGAGLGRLARERFDAQPSAPPPSPRDPNETARTFWSAGDYSRLSRRYAPMAERLVAEMDLAAGADVLDVAAGDGNVALAAARQRATVTALDLTPELVERGRARTREAQLPIDWHVGDARALPFEDASFDVLASAFGIIHVPDMRAAAVEVVRVLRPGGVLGLATWTSAGAMGTLLRTARRVTDARPERWGSYEGLQLALDRFPAFEVAEHHETWHYADLNALWEELTEPPGQLSSAASPNMPATVTTRLAPFLEPDGQGLALSVDWSLVLARKNA
jgi:ubiquinone/menaquinone biosynthesis C-methylase UbiE